MDDLRFKASITKPMANLNNHSYCYTRRDLFCKVAIRSGVKIFGPTLSHCHCSTWIEIVHKSVVLHAARQLKIISQALLWNVLQDNSRPNILIVLSRIGHTESLAVASLYGRAADLYNRSQKGVMNSHTPVRKMKYISLDYF